MAENSGPKTELSVLLCGPVVFDAAAINTACVQCGQDERRRCGSIEDGV